MLLAVSLALAGCSQAGQNTPQATPKTTSRFGQPAVQPGQISGASRAACTPSPCQPAQGYTMRTLANVSNDNGTASARTYGVYRPQNLVPSPANLAPAVLVFYASGHCGFIPTSRFGQLAPADRFVVISMEVPCGRDNNWDKKQVNDAGQTATPNDEPYVAAVIKDLTRCPHSAAAAYQCVDPQRIYAVGQSSGGGMALDIMCDATNSSLVRGYLSDSASLGLFGGAPYCPTTNRSFFVMMALGNAGIDQAAYNGTSDRPNLLVPTFADWAARRLSCPGRRVNDAIGSPTASTLRYRYFGACAYASAGSAAVETLGVVNGAHGWGCQDSDPKAPPACPSMPNPPGLDARGRPRTNGLFVENEFWKFVSQGVSSTTKAPPLAGTPASTKITSPSGRSAVSGPAVGVSAVAANGAGVSAVQFRLDGKPLGQTRRFGNTYFVFWDTTTARNGAHAIKAVSRHLGGHVTTSASTVIFVRNGAAQFARLRLVSLGDSFSSGDGASPYLAGTNATGDRCRRSLDAYPFVLAVKLKIATSQLALRSCAGASIADFYRANRDNHETAQLKWIGKAARTVTVTIGWSDSGLDAAVRSCGRTPSRCTARWRVGVQHAIATMSKRSGSRSLFRLYRRIAASAPHSKVIVLGYPRLFPSAPPQSCGGGRGLGFHRAAMIWINSAIATLDGTVGAAAAAAHVRYARPSYGAFMHHEACTPRPLVGSGLYPNVAGQRTLGAIVSKLQ